MADVGNDYFMRYVYRGEEGELIPEEATHITVAEDVTVVLARAFYRHRKIVEIICHDRVEKIEREAFYNCRRLRRVIIPGVKEVEECAFWDCAEPICGSRVLMDVECGKLEIINDSAFNNCRLLTSINLPSARIVGSGAFSHTALTDVKFGNKLERIEERAFAYNCVIPNIWQSLTDALSTSLERITIPLKDGLITSDDIFKECSKLKQVDLVERVELNGIIAALHLEDWRNDMNEEIDLINRILPNARAGYYSFTNDDDGEKAQTIRTWIRSVRGKLIHYQAEHQRILNEATTTLQLVLPRDIAMNSVLSYLALPSYTEVSLENEEDGEDVIE